MNKLPTIEEAIKFLQSFLRNSVVSGKGLNDKSKKYIIDRDEAQNIQDTIILLRDFL